jgi:hypothetical protein
MPINAKNLKYHRTERLSSEPVVLLPYLSLGWAAPPPLKAFFNNKLPKNCVHRTRPSSPPEYPWRLPKTHRRLRKNQPLGPLDLAVTRARQPPLTRSIHTRGSPLPSELGEDACGPHERPLTVLRGCPRITDLAPRVLTRCGPEAECASVLTLIQSGVVNSVCAGIHTMHYLSRIDRECALLRDPARRI